MLLCVVVVGFFLREFSLVGEDVRFWEECSESPFSDSVWILQALGLSVDVFSFLFCLFKCL